jgi:hypothetical protein
VAGGHSFLLQTAASTLWEVYADAETEPAKRRQRAGQDLCDSVMQVLRDTWRIWLPETRKAMTAVALANLKAMNTQAGSADRGEYDMATVASLVRDSFTARELQRFCRDRTIFSPVSSRFGPMFSLEDMIDVLLEHSQKRLLLTDLLLEIQRYNPRQYQRYAPQLVPRHMFALLDLGPELRLLEKQGFVSQDAAIPGGWRVRPQVLLWWLADQLGRVVHSEQTLEAWLQEQVLERSLTWEERQQMVWLGGEVEGLLRKGVTPLIEKAAKPVPER